MNHITLPKDPRHQRFADLILRGETAPEAYRKAGFKVTNLNSAKAAASRMLTNVSIKNYIQAVKSAAAERAAEGAVGTVLEKRMFLARVWRTPLRAIDPNDPSHKDGDLISKYKRVTSETGETEEIVKLCPLKAIAEDNKLSGDDPEANALQQMAEAFTMLGKMPTPLPVDQM